VWLVKDREQPLQDNEHVCDCITASSEVQVLVERRVNAKVAALLPRLRDNDSTMTFVGLCSDGLRDVDAEEMAEALQVNIVVTELSLRDNKIGGPGCVALANALRVNSTVTDVDLQINNIGDEGCAVIAEALKVNTVVQNLRLDHNRIGDAGCTALAEALKVNTAVEDIICAATASMMQSVLH
jgi:hypothetical protein